MVFVYDWKNDAEAELKIFWTSMRTYRDAKINLEATGAIPRPVTLMVFEL